MTMLEALAPYRLMLSIQIENYSNRGIALEDLFAVVIPSKDTAVVFERGVEIAMGDARPLVEALERQPRSLAMIIEDADGMMQRLYFPLAPAAGDA